MKKFEVYYKDKAIPVPLFMVVVSAKDQLEAFRMVKSIGYSPIRVKQLGWVK